MRTIPTTTTSSLIAPTATVTSAQRSSWHSPIPYLFGGLAAMLGLIAFALLILACSYWRLSGQLQNEENNNNRGMGGDEKEGDDSANKESVKVYEEKILVIMAGDNNPTFLATPAYPKSSSFNNGVGNQHDKHQQNHETSEKPEKEMEVHIQPTIPQSQETQQQSQRS